MKLLRLRFFTCSFCVSWLCDASRISRLIATPLDSSCQWFFQVIFFLLRFFHITSYYIMFGSKGIFPLTWYPRITPHFAAPAILLYVYIYSIKATLQIIHPKSGYPYFYQILMVNIPVYSFLHKKTSYHLAGFHCIFKTTYMLTFPENHSSCDSWSSPHPISNSQLHVLPHFHLCPIYLVVFKGVYFLTNGISHLKGGFTLRCLQRLSLPGLATRP